MSSDNLIYDALVEAITRAFFQQQTYYTYDSSGNNFPHPYGGQIADVVEKIMATPEFQTVMRRVERNVNKMFDVKSIQEKALPLIMKKLEEEVNKKFRNENYGLGRDISDARNNEVAKIVIKKLESDEIKKLIGEKVEKKIRTNEYDIDIRISVVATPKEN